MRRLIKRLLALIGALLLLVVVGLVALPVWFPLVLRPLLAKQNVHYKTYERDGYGALVLREVEFQKGSLQFQAERLRLLIPTTWLSRVYSRDTAEPYVLVEGWRLVSAAPQKAPAQTPPGQATTNTPTASLEKTTAILKRWVPAITLTNGVVQLAKNQVEVPFATWKAGQIDARVNSNKLLPLQSELHAPSPQGPWTVTSASPTNGLSAQFQLVTNAAGLYLTGSAQWRSNHAELQAQFPTLGALPETAALSATNLVVPKDLLNLPLYRPLQGQVAAQWRTGAFYIGIVGTAEPLKDGAPARLQLRMEGTTNSVLIRTAQITAEGVQADLTHDVQLTSRPPYLSAPAEFHAKADLARLGFAQKLSGKASADLLVAPSSGRYPTVRFRTSGKDINSAELAEQLKKVLRDPMQIGLDSVLAEGSLKWPLVTLDKLEGQLRPATGVTGVTRVQCSGTMDITRSIVSNMVLQVHSPGGLVGGSKLPSWDSLELTVKASGPFMQPVHSGKLVAKFISYRQQVLDAFSLDWSGRALDLHSFHLSATQGTNSLLASGSLAGKNGTFSLLLSTLSFSGNGRPLLQLQRPAQFDYQPKVPQHLFAIKTSALDLSGPGGELRLKSELTWPQVGSIECLAKGLHSSMLAQWLHLPKITLESLSCSAAWSNSPAQFQITMAAQTWRTNMAMGVEASIQSDGQAISIPRLAILSSNAPLVLATGELPISLAPASHELVQVDTNRPIRLTATAQPHASFWEQLSVLTKWRLEEPQLQANISGTLTAPQAVVQLKAARVTPAQSLTAPAIGPLNVAVAMDRSRLSLQTFQVAVEGQPITAEGEMPIKKGALGDLIRHKQQVTQLAEWEKAFVRLRVDNASMKALQVLAPKVITPEGSVDIDLLVRPGLNVNGSISVSGARTLPIGTLGPVRDINLQIRFMEGLASLDFGRARIGGVPVTVQGRAYAAVTNLTVPPFQLSVKGSKIPLARQAQVIIRADADLLIIKTNADQPLITGKAQLRDSLFLSDLAALIPGKVVNPNERPPYFSIEEKPLNAWRLEIDVSGNRGLQARTPLLTATVSPNIRLTGTLGSPFAVGDVRVDSGSVKFPFGSLDIQQGLITTTPQDPAHPQILLTASARQYGYDIRLDVSGSANSPILQFTSTPALSSDQILMMLTAGELPKGIGALTPQQRAETFAMFLGRDLLAKLGFGDGSSDRLIVRTGEEFSDQGKPTYDIEYKLNKRWSVTAEYDKFGDFNAGVKWRVYSK